MIFFQDELMQNWELAKDMNLGLYVSGFWHIHAKTPRGTVAVSYTHLDVYKRQSISGTAA